MSSQTQLIDESLSPEPVEREEVHVIFTANGSHEASRQIWRTGALVGMESLNTRPPPEIPVDFVDWPFSKLEEGFDIGELFDHHIRVVADEQPRYAVAPDIDDQVAYRDAIEWADELSQYADIVIVVPKTVLPTDIPSRFRVGMPCQERYGPPPWRWNQYRPCGSVHLLGGSPVKTLEIPKYGVPVDSVDTSVPVKPAKYGEYWSATRGKWTKGSAPFYSTLQQSYRNLRLAFNERRSIRDVRCRNRRHDWYRIFRRSTNAELWGPDEEPPTHSRALALGLE